MASPVAREFEPSRISPGETIAAGSGIALFVFLFFHWFAGGSAWSYFSVIDVLLAAIAVVAVAVAGAKAMGRPLFGANEGLVLAFIGTVASSIILTFVLEGDNRRLGLWLSFAAALGVLYGGWRTMHEEPGTTGPLGDMLSGIGGSKRTNGEAPPRTNGEAPTSSTAPTTPMAATDSPGVPGGGAAGVSPGKEGPGAPHPGTSTGGPDDGDGDVPAATGAAAADPVPGQTGAQTPPGLAGEPPAGEGTHPPGL